MVSVYYLLDLSVSTKWECDHFQNIYNTLECAQHASSSEFFANLLMLCECVQHLIEIFTTIRSKIFFLLNFSVSFWNTSNRVSKTLFILHCTVSYFSVSKQSKIIIYTFICWNELKQVGEYISWSRYSFHMQKKNEICENLNEFILTEFP